MYDFMKFIGALDKDVLLNHDGLEFESKVSEKTGEVLEFPMTTKRRYKGQSFQVFDNCTIGNGSIHKYWQNGTNWKDFDLIQFKEALRFYCKEFGINPKETRLQNLEFGLNIITSFKHSKESLKKMFVSYKGKPFEFMESKGKEVLGVVCKLSHYQIKIYSKAIQYGLSENVLRIEIKCTKMQKISKLPLYLSDLLSPTLIAKLRQELIQVVKDIIVMDNSLVGLTDKGEIFLLQVANPNYWNDLTRAQRSRAKNKYSKLVTDKSLKHFQEKLIQTVVKKCNVITSSIKGNNVTLTDYYIKELRSKNILQFESSIWNYEEGFSKL